MDKLSLQLVRSLSTLLRRECQLYERYVTLAREERSFLVRFNAAKVSELTAARAVLCDSMLAAQEQRLELMRKFPGREGTRLRQLISNYCHPKDAKQLLPLAEKLRKLVQTAQAVQ